jgi:hypothetical protein
MALKGHRGDCSSGDGFDDGNYESGGIDLGFFDSIKKAFDAGGIKVRLETPNSFKWSDGSIPVTVKLTGHKTEPRTVTNLRFTLAEEREDSSGETTSISRRNQGASVSVDRSESIELQPLQEDTIDFAMPLATGGEAGSVAAMAGKVMDAISLFSTHAQWYSLSVHTTVEGAKAQKGTSHRIRNGDVSFTASISFGN